MALSLLFPGWSCLGRSIFLILSPLSPWIPLHFLRYPLGRSPRNNPRTPFVIPGLGRIVLATHSLGLRPTLNQEIHYDPWKLISLRPPVRSWENFIPPLDERNAGPYFDLSLSAATWNWSTMKYHTLFGFLLSWLSRLSFYVVFVFPESSIFWLGWLCHIFVWFVYYLTVMALSWMIYGTMLVTNLLRDRSTNVTSACVADYLLSSLASKAG